MKFYSQHFRHLCRKNAEYDFNRRIQQNKDDMKHLRQKGPLQLEY